MLERFTKYFAPKEELVLTDEEKGLIADFLIKNGNIWKVHRKYIFNKLNVLTRKLSRCAPEELKSLQDRIGLCQEFLTDYEKIKQDYLKKNSKSDTVTAKKDLWDYIMSKDVRDKSGKIRLGST